jgi:hypothetical protein
MLALLKPILPTHNPVTAVYFRGDAQQTTVSEGRGKANSTIYTKRWCLDVAFRGSPRRDPERLSVA